MRLVHATAIGLAIFAVTTDARRRKKGKNRRKKPASAPPVSGYDKNNFQAFVDGLDYYGDEIDDGDRAAKKETGYWPTWRSLSMAGLIHAGGLKYCVDLFGKDNHRKPQPGQQHFSTLQQRWRQCEQLKEIMTVRRDECKDFFYDIVYNPEKWNPNNSRWIQRKKYCSAIVRVPNPVKPCIRNCAARDHGCRKIRTECVKAREDRGLEPFGDDPGVDMTDDLGCKPLTGSDTHGFAQMKKNHYAKIKAAKAKMDSLQFKICRGNRPQRRRCNLAKKKAKRDYLVIRNTKVHMPDDDRPYCDPNEYQHNADKPKKNKHKKSKKRKQKGKAKKKRPGAGDVFSNHAFRDTQKEGMRGLGASSTQGDYESMVALLNAFEDAYGNNALEAAADEHEQRKKNRKNGARAQGDDDTIAMSVVAADARD